ncbi:MAG TPA: 4-hydroxyphenylpyruvate dioxygenase [Chitinophagaceae bacterium]|nr:4-hydroxyphenylpyruvate dioxygenase [Chitinophagaceae bacterium]
METASIPSPPLTADFLPILGTDHIEFYVGNARQAAHFYQSAFGFQPLAYSGPETGVRDHASYALSQGKIRLVFTTTLLPDSEIARQVNRHGDGVRSISLWVEDARDAYTQTIARGAVSCFKPQMQKDDQGFIWKSAICLYGDTIHTFIERTSYQGPFLPGYRPWNPRFRSAEAGLEYVDHCVGNVGWNQMNQWVGFYEKVMGFHNLISFDDKTITTEYSALMSKVMANGNGRIKFPINEPAQGKKKSQIEEYLEFYGGPGVQHIAMASSDIIRTVSALRDRGVEFLVPPGYYYETLGSRVGKIDEDLRAVGELGILVDRDEEGYLLQIFTKPVQDRPTLFFEIIQRKGATSFGAGNFKALFEAIEQEQALRGNL